MLSSTYDDTITEDVMSAAVNVEMYQPRITNPDDLFRENGLGAQPSKMMTPVKKPAELDMEIYRKPTTTTTPKITKLASATRNDTKSVSDLFDTVWNAVDDQSGSNKASLTIIDDWLDAIGADLKHSIRQYLSIRDHSWDSKEQSLVRHACSTIVNSLVSEQMRNSRKLARLILYLSSDDEFAYLFSQSPELVTFLQTASVIQTIESTEMFDLLLHLIRNYPSSFQEHVSTDFLEEIKSSLMSEETTMRSDLMELFAIYTAHTGARMRLQELQNLPHFFRMLVSNLSNDDAKLLANSLCILVHAVQDPNVRSELFSEPNVFKICHLLFSTLAKSSSWAKHTTMSALLSSMTQDSLIRTYLFKFVSMYFSEQVEACISHLWNQPAIPIAGQVLQTLTLLALENPDSDICMQLMQLLKRNIIEDGATTCLANVIETCQFIHRDYEACRSIFEGSISLAEALMSAFSNGNLVSADFFLETLFKSWNFVYETLERTLVQQWSSANPVMSLEPVMNEINRLLICTMKLSALGFRRRIDPFPTASSGPLPGISSLIRDWLGGQKVGAMTKEDLGGSNEKGIHGKSTLVKENMALMLLAMQPPLKQQACLFDGTTPISTDDNSLAKFQKMVEDGLNSKELYWGYTCYRLKTDLLVMTPYVGQNELLPMQDRIPADPENRVVLSSPQKRREKIEMDCSSHEDLESLNAKLQESVQDFQKALQLQASISQQQSRILQGKVALLEESKMMQQRVLQQTEARLNERDVSLKLAKEQVTVLNSTILSLKEEIKLKDQKKQALEETISQLKANMETSQATHEQQVHDLNNRHDRQIQEFNAQKQELETQLEKLLISKKTLELKCQAQQEHIQDLEQEVQGQEEEYDQLLSKLAQNFQIRKQKKRTKEKPAISSATSTTRDTLLISE